MAVVVEYSVRGEALDREPATDADLVTVQVGLIDENFDVGVPGDRAVHIRAGHSIGDVGVLGDGFEGHVRHAFADKALSYVEAEVAPRCWDAGQVVFLRCAFA